VGPVPGQAGAVEAARRVGAVLRAGARDRALVHICTKMGYQMNILGQDKDPLFFGNKDLIHTTFYPEHVILL